MRWFVGWRMHLAHALIAFTIGSLSGGFVVHKWYQAESAKALREQVKEANRQIEREQASDASTQATGEAVANAVNGVQWRTRTLIKEVPVYVTPETDAAYGNLPVGFVRLHDAAAVGTTPVPLGSGELDSAPSTVAPSTAIAGVVDNYGTCHYYRQIAEGWQSWYRSQSALWAGDGVRTAPAPSPVP